MSWKGTFRCAALPLPTLETCGGLTHFDGQTWTTYTQENSPLLEEQIWELESRAIAGGYELWVGTAGQGIAVLTVSSAVFADGFESGDWSNWQRSQP